MKYNVDKFFTGHTHVKIDLHPFVELPSFLGAKNLVARCGFKITDIRATRLPNGFIAITLNWDSNALAQGGFSYAARGCRSYGYDCVTMELEFPSVKYRWVSTSGAKRRYQSPFCLTVGLRAESDIGLEYGPLWFQNLKYGAVCYFGPKGWDYESKGIQFFNFEEPQ